MKNEKVNNIIQQNRISKSTSLDLSNLNLIDIPNEVFELPHLVILKLENNFISEIPSEINKLQNLEYIFLKDNNITELPEEIAFLAKLKSIDVRNNPVINPPIEIANKNINVIRNYFHELQKQGVSEKLNEVKVLIVGEGGAGKTTLARKLMNPQSRLPREEETTHGIDITQIQFSISNNETFRANVWDFGGQEIYHATHQFFLSKRSLYILVTDTRYESTDFDYWLQTIERLSANSPIIVIQNEKNDRKKQLDISSLKGRFPNINSVVATNLLSNRGLPEVIESIQKEIAGLPHMGSKLPLAWISIRQELEAIRNEVAYISLNTYLEICKKHDVSEKKRALFLSDFYHDLGVFLHFQDNPILKYLIILKPEWGTDAVYKVLDNVETVEKFGRFNRNDLMAIWSSARYEGMHDELLELMKKFELCYQIGEIEEYIAPQLLRVEKPDYLWDHTNNLSVKISYDFLPKGIMSRFIVRMNRYIKDHSLVWREGVILTRNGASAEVIKIYGQRNIEINIMGEPVSRKEFMTIIIEDFDRLHETYPKIEATKLIPCNCIACSTDLPPEYYPYDVLKRYITHGKTTIDCRKSFENISIKKLIGDFDPKFLPDDQDINETLERIKRQIKSSFTDYLEESNEQ